MASRDLTGMPPERPASPHLYVFVDLPHFLRCIICTEVMRNPMMLACGHSFCHSCVQQALNCKRECPLCRKTETCMGPNIVLCQALDEQLVFCRFSTRKEEPTGLPNQPIEKGGCQQVVKKCDAPSHERECVYRWVRCNLTDLGGTNSFCTAYVRFNELEQHQEECKYRLMPCPNEGCDAQVSICSVERHKETCLWETMRCPHDGCTQFFTRKSMPQHELTCPHRIQHCAFAKWGCEEKGTVQHIEDHMRNRLHEHLGLMCRAVASLEEFREKAIVEKRTSCGTKKFRCIVNNFFRLVKKQVIDINLDASWKLKIWPNGEDKRHKGYISIRLFSREATPNFKVEGPYQLRIVNQADPLKSIGKVTEATSREWADSVRGWGFPAFAKIEDILAPAAGYLKDDKLIIDVEAEVKSMLEIVEYTDTSIE